MMIRLNRQPVESVSADGPLCFCPRCLVSQTCALTTAGIGILVMICDDVLHACSRQLCLIDELAVVQPQGSY